MRSERPRIESGRDEARRGGLSRRDALKFIGGGAAGTMLSPLPWKLLDDLAIWTQNGSHLMHVPRGAVTTRATHCTLCPAGCGLRVRCAGGRPIGIAGVPQHPRSFGAACPLALAAHHLSYHPHRTTTSLRRSAPDAPAQRISNAAATEELASWVVAAERLQTRGAVVVLDARPERSVSGLYRAWLAALGCGVYVLPPGVGAGGLERLLHAPIGPIGVDLENVSTVLSFGAPILDGWAAPGRVQARWSDPERRFALIQAESRPSTTALHAEQWLAIRPGSEAALAFGLAHVILAENLYAGAALGARATDFEDYRDFVRGFTPEVTAALTGIDAATIRDTARRFACNAPAVAVAGIDPGAGPVDATAELAIWGLDLLVGCIGCAGAFVERRPVPLPVAVEDTPGLPASRLADLPDGSVHVLIVDGTPSTCVLPWALVQRKLAPAGRMAMLTAYDAGLSRRAHLVLATAAPFESLDEVPSAPDAPTASFAVALPLRQSRVPAIDPVALVLRLAAQTTPGALPAPETLDAETLVRQRAEAIAASGRGMFFDSTNGKTTAVGTMTAADCDQALRQGGCWFDEPAPQRELPRFALLGREMAPRAALLQGEWQRPWSPASGSSPSVVLAPFAGAGAGLGILPPVLAKLYRESDLLAPCGLAFVHASTADDCGVGDGDWAFAETRRGRALLRMRVDAAVRPGVVHVAVGADGWAFGDGKSHGNALLDVCDVGPDGTWRLTPATLHRA